MNKSKAKGTAAETAVVRAIQKRGFPSAERRSLKGTHDQGDITGCPGICWEVKGGQAAWDASDGQILAWLAETEKERINAGADIGVLVVQRKGIGPKNAHRWWAILPADRVVRHHFLDRMMPPLDFPVRLHLGDVCRLLRADGYGEPLPEAVGW